MITIFILLGLSFLGGGIAAIVDGMPYMVLERGFTQVIIGTVVAVAGVVMLALSWLLVELRWLKKTVSNAATAISVASMIGSPAAESAVPMPRVPSEPEDTAGTLRPGLVVAGAGALAGAGATLAASQVLASAASPEDKATEAELSGAHPTDAVRAVPDLDRDARDEAREADVDALPAFDPFRPMAPRGEPKPEPAVEAAAEPEPEADLAPVPASEAEPEVAPMSDPLAGQEALQVTRPDEQAESHAATHGPSDIEDPLTPKAVPAASREPDEFGMLRESLAGLGLGPEPAGGRIEPSFTDVYGLGEHADEQEGGRDDDLAAAASWMDHAPERRTPWFENAAPAAQQPVVPPSGVEPAIVPTTVWPKLDIPQPQAVEPQAPEPQAPEPQAAEPEAPVVELPPWPPHARDAAPFEPEPPLPQERDLPQEQDWDDAVGEQAAPEDAPAPASEDETASGSEAAPVAPEASEGEAAPAASDEGIVGAYQVGEAHFTIFADGSIQARTPDGDYSFASMDELKVYLASEKSRLGV